jgi:putative ABC transport system substrate-binding protein
LNAAQQLPEIEIVRGSLGIEAILTDVRSGPDIQRALDSFSEQRNVGLIVLGSTVSNVHRDLIVGLATKHKYPAVYPGRAFVTAGGLLSYASDNQVLYQQAGTYIARILNGEKAGDLPVQNPTKYEMVINLKAAKAIDIEVPPTLLARADEVIE